MVAGCLLGILIPKLIMGSSSDNHGVNRAATMNNLIGSLSEDELKLMLVDAELTEFDHKVDKMFKKIDVDNSGYIDKTEIKKYLVDLGIEKEEIDPLVDKLMAQDKDKNDKLDIKEFNVM